ncbi:MAPK/MAK/MRK overlapping kinase-like [Periplaneta americana]|uniref:MAPK/MAK/MRK overlapping kinase-like n=1 Tax=Periplaneta americana TaxID=6978 RepID=UPI0037E8EEDF
MKPLFPGANEMDQLAKIHGVLGTPHPHLIAKFRRHKSRNCEYAFPSRVGSNFSCMLSSVSEAGRDIMKLMLVYDPQHRSNVRRLLEHRYFADLREQEMLCLRQQPCSVTPAKTGTCSGEWRNPALQSYMTTVEKRRKVKVRVPTRRTRRSFL